MFPTDPLPFCRDCELLPGCLELLLQFRGLRTLVTSGACTGLTPEGVVAVAKQVRAQGSGLHVSVWWPEAGATNLQALVKQEGRTGFVRWEDYCVSF